MAAITNHLLHDEWPGAALLELDYHVIWNDGSGKAAQIDQLRQLLSCFATRWTKICRDVDLPNAIIGSRCRTVVAAGGDGTVNAVVNALMEVDASVRPSLSIVPLGTANDFAGTLAISDDVAEAVQQMRESGPRSIDIVQVHAHGFQQYFANVAAGGNCVRVSELMTDEIKQRWGAMSYIRGAVSVLPDMISYRIQVDIDGEQLELDSWAILVANGRTNAGRIEVAPWASPTDGLLDIILIKDGTVADMAEIVTRNLIGSFAQCDQVIYRQAKRLELRSDPSMRFTFDGEIVDAKPIRFCVEPAPIQMFVGRQFQSHVEPVELG
ncbi:YegS/Rv2252/BmrU family lipid kinase [Stieleria sp. ICT_E10.1]|uniref:diacylglycerol/lipid kinase family protein n=1 Tax=Stieleria sedimenti TaxID=2976331 RepID=UPI00218018C9|nr:YegS/Rv2252/BmrU family lipid kinase [Stieleria sedimenti]MCS7469756.1 YegS/Rv2252/BmrU family lipid kinase [Stieleria sedimenti]